MSSELEGIEKANSEIEEFIHRVVSTILIFATLIFTLLWASTDLKTLLIMEASSIFFVFLLPRGLILFLHSEGPRDKLRRSITSLFLLYYGIGYSLFYLWVKGRIWGLYTYFDWSAYITFEIFMYILLGILFYYWYTNNFAFNKVKALREQYSEIKTLIYNTLYLFGGNSIRKALRKNKRYFPALYLLFGYSCLYFGVDSLISFFYPLLRRQIMEAIFYPSQFLFLYAFKPTKIFFAISFLYLFFLILLFYRKQIRLLSKQELEKIHELRNFLPIRIAIAIIGLSLEIIGGNLISPFFMIVFTYKSLVGMILMTIGLALVISLFKEFSGLEK